jgi:hypothetical protein
MRFIETQNEYSFFDKLNWEGTTQKWALTRPPRSQWELGNDITKQDTSICVLAFISRSRLHVLGILTEVPGLKEPHRIKI